MTVFLRMTELGVARGRGEVRGVAVATEDVVETAKDVERGERGGRLSP